MALVWCSLMEVTLFVMTLLSIIVIALCLLALELNGLFGTTTVGTIITTSTTLMPMFAYSYLSEQITADLMEIGDIFYNSAWYYLPQKYSRLVVLPIGRTHEVFRLRCLGLVECSLDVFSSVRCFCL